MTPGLASESHRGPGGWHACSTQQVLADCGVTEQGLSEATARARLQEHGPNEPPAGPRRAWWQTVTAQFQSPLIYLLLLAAVLALMLGESSDALVILVVVAINGVIGAVQEGRAKRSMDSLRRLAALHARVWREGRERVLPARELVVGDILVLAAGDAVGADARVLSSSALMAVEMPLTGEAVPVAKHAATLPDNTLLPERRNLVFTGTHISSGRGRAVVVSTGSETEIGKIARLATQTVERATPLELRISQLGRHVLTVAALLSLLIMILGWWRGIPGKDLLMVTISQTVSVVPEGLPVAMTLALAIGTQRMARQRAIVRRLAAVETLGCTSVICTDKTGTLTKGEMTVTAIWLPSGIDLAVTGVGYDPAGTFVQGGETVPDPGKSAGLRALLEAGALCNDAKLVPPTATDPRWRALGDPTEAALITLALKGGIDPARLQNSLPRRAELAFDPEAKLMATEHGRGRIMIKGAPEAVLALCATRRVGHREEPLTMAERRRALAAADQLAGRALRVLGLAEVPDRPAGLAGGFEAMAGQGTLLGLVGQMDPPREEAANAIATCRVAGIRPVMVTGDHRTTALGIARELGLAREGDRVIDGGELEAMPEQDLRSGLDCIAVFARVLPAQKLRIVQAFQADGQVVAMTGDGVNDAPALARADVGVALGLTGSEVAKDAAKIVITDDNFATLMKAVENGRLIYASIRKLLLFLLATSIDEVVIVLTALMLNCPLPLAAVQILWINLVTEGTLALNLIMEQNGDGEMNRPPLRPDSALIDRAMAGRLVVMVTASVAATLGFFLWRLASAAPLALVRTETFTMLAVCQWFNLLNCENATKSALRLGIWRNKWLLGGLLLANALQAAVIYWPSLNRLFHTVPIPVGDFFLIGAVASTVLWAEELRKALRRIRAQRQARVPSRGGTGRNGAAFSARISANGAQSHP